MLKKIFVINGSGGSGKDTFVKFVSLEMNDRMKKFHTVWNFSSVDKIKDIARQIGWDGSKTEKDRKFLSDLKNLSTEYCDMPFESIESKVKEFLDDENAVFLFLHIREPAEIERAVKEFHAKSILIVRDNIQVITSNDSDKNVFNYENYDLTIENNEGLEELHRRAADLVDRELGVRK